MKIFICILYTISLPVRADDICSDILNIVNSPSHADSPCSTPFKKVFIELNYIDQQLIAHEGVEQIFPNANIRFGLPLNSEFFIGPPNYIVHKNFPKSGSTDTYFGLKHTINYNSKWVFALLGTANTPGGSTAYGSESWGANFNGIAYYNINDQLSITGELGISRHSDSKLEGGNSFNSINPYICLGFSPNATLSFYWEVYGQSKISALQGAGYNFDGGISFIVFPNTILNLSAGQQLHNYLGGFKHYINAGIAVML